LTKNFKRPIDRKLQYAKILLAVEAASKKHKPTPAGRLLAGNLQAPPGFFFSAIARKEAIRWQN